MARWRKDELESRIVEAGGCAAAMRSRPDWADHPQGSWRPGGERPPAGLRVLDLTRILAGPVCTRFLAGYGADVLRIDPPGWDEGVVIPDVTLGKSCARLDLERDRR